MLPLGITGNPVANISWPCRRNTSIRQMGYGDSGLYPPTIIGDNNGGKM
jgi:hypothetical protein